MQSTTEKNRAVKKCSSNGGKIHFSTVNLACVFLVLMVCHIESWAGVIPFQSVGQHWIVGFPYRPICVSEK